ncbi:MAG: histidine phosphatase family protein [Gammaproteobacteria bacterium]|jgi:phosphohistidine phosphatase|nr:histidine phosphatase family protein [Gammaproteobacteria bacterium]
MRRLILLRHAKSSWGNPTLADIDRSLNDRGRHDAPLMAQRLLRAGTHPDCIFCSTARRTCETVAEVLAAFGMPAGAVSYREDLYLASVRTAERVIAGAPDTATTVLVVGHNPTCTELANRYGDLAIDNVPTCGCVTIDLDIAAWSEIGSARGTTVGFDYPKRAVS